MFFCAFSNSKISVPSQDQNKQLKINTLIPERKFLNFDLSESCIMENGHTLNEVSIHYR